MKRCDLDWFESASLRQLAELMGWDKARWSRYLAGKKHPNTKTLRAIADRLGADVGEVVSALEKRIRERKAS